MKEFVLDLGSPRRPLAHYWDLCVGSCHAATALRSDWKRQLEQCHRELGSPYGFWAASKEEYFKLYQVTAQAVKSVDGALPVGGPATSNNAWIPDFLAFCRESGAPVDFVSTHQYPTDVVLGYGVEDSANFQNPFDVSRPERIAGTLRLAETDPEQYREKLEEYSVFQSHLWERVDRGVLTDMARQARGRRAACPCITRSGGAWRGWSPTTPSARPSSQKLYWTAMA